MGGAVYFSIGDAIAGLGIFLLIPQYLKPIYVFRLRVLGIGLRWLYAFPGVGFLCVVVAALTPYFPAWLPLPLRSSLVWESLGAALYAASYSALAWVYIFPARSSRRSIANYVRAGTHLLAGASEEDRVELATDIVANIKKLIRLADARGHGAPAASNGKASGASFSESFLHILSDPVFCRTLVARVPWDAARILQAFSEERPSAQVGKAFVMEITRQAVISSGAGGANQVATQAFSETPPLSKAAFGDAYLNRHYLPWEGPSSSDYDQLNAEKMERICAAAALTIDSHIADGFLGQCSNIVRLQETFDVISRRIAILKKREADAAQLANALGRSVKHIVDATRRHCAAAGVDGTALYAEMDGVRDFSALDAIAELVVSVLENTSHDFSGFDDPFWSMARDIWDAVLPRFGAQPAGMDALQQRVTMKLMEKIGESMEGFPSPLMRQALAIVGPYAARGESKERTAFKICRDHLYRALESLPQFFENDPERARRLLPNNVRYEADTAELVHRYSFGGEDRTSLMRLTLPAALSLAPDAIALRPQAASPAAIAVPS